MAYHMLLLLSLLVLTVFQGVRAVEYVVTNTATSTPGGTLFNNQIGLEYSKQTLDSVSAFIWRTLGQTNPADRRDIQRVSLFIDDMDGVAYATNNEIHLSARYIANYTGNLKGEITGVLYHESTHIWQWNGNGQAPGGLIEGIADYVRFKAGYIPSHLVQPKGDERWDQGYDVTARFLEYCNGLREGFVAQLNANMRTGYSNDFFLELLGKTVDQLWSDYNLVRQSGSWSWRAPEYGSSTIQSPYRASLCLGIILCMFGALDSQYDTLPLMKSKL